MTKLTFKQFLLNEIRDERYGTPGDRDPELWTHLVNKPAPKAADEPNAPNDGRTPDADGHPAKGCHGCNYHEAQHNHWRKKK